MTGDDTAWIRKISLSWHFIFIDFHWLLLICIDFHWNFQWKFLLWITNPRNQYDQPLWKYAERVWSWRFYGTDAFYRESFAVHQIKGGEISLTGRSLYFGLQKTFKVDIIKCRFGIIDCTAMMKTVKTMYGYCKEGQPSRFIGIEESHVKNLHWRSSLEELFRL